MRRTSWMIVALLIGCGRSGIPIAAAGGGYVCGPGTYVSGDECLPTGDAPPTANGDAGANGAGDAGANVDGGAPPADLGSVPADLSTPPRAPTAVTFQIDPAHTGGQPGSHLKPPLTRHWSVTLDSTSLSYPLIVRDRVFLVGLGTGGARLYALSAASGDPVWGPIALGGTSFGTGANPAWDAGKVFIDNGAVAQAYDEASGALLWTSAIGGTNWASAPVAADGTVFLYNNQDLWALDEGTGAFRWEQYSGLFLSAPAYASGTVVAYVYDDLTAMHAADGSTAWTDHRCYNGASTAVPVVYDGLVFAPNCYMGAYDITRLTDGALVGSYVASVLPAFENGLGFFRNASTLEGHTVDGTVLWSFTGDGQLDSTPMAAGGFVYIGSSSGNLYALDERSGMQVWTDTLGAAIAPSNDFGYQRPMTGLAASDDLLVVPAGATLTAYGN
jgi:outer membrane protein assembly factor BamB